MKPILVIILSLLFLKILTFTLKSLLPLQEIRTFVVNEKFNQEEELSIHRGWIRESLAYNKSRITDDIFPAEGLDSLYTGKFHFADMHHYLVYLMEKNPEMVFDTIMNIDDYPDSLRGAIKEKHALNEIKTFIISQQFHPFYEDGSRLVPIIHSIDEENGNIEISIRPFSQQRLDPREKFEFFVNGDQLRFTESPFLYNGPTKNITAISTNPVTHEKQTFSFK